MTPELWQRLKRVYTTAAELQEPERAQYIAKECGSDSELRKELEALLRASDESTLPAGELFESPHDIFPSVERSFPEGEIILGRFEIVRLLGTGGMGEVYEANDLELGRIALKTIRADILADRRALLRFRKEVQLARKVSGPNVCRIHEFFPAGNGSSGSHPAFLTMEFLEGTTLADKIRESGPFSWPDAQRTMIEICAGLQSIHDAGIVHRDLKSRNIMLASRNGVTCAVVMDFGLAHEISTSVVSESAVTTSTPGAIVGTLNYMAPEQFEGREVTPATDIFALGVVFYEVVTGERPFVGDTPIAAAVSRGKPPCLASAIRKDLPRHCDEIICKCLEFDSEKRYQSAHKVAEDLKGHRRAFPLKLQKGWLQLLAGAVCTILLLSGLLLIPALRERVQGVLFSSHEKHVAFLPFDIVGNNPQTQALGDGLMDSLAGKLSNLDTTNPNLWVVPVSEVRSRKVKTPTSALREFGATIVVEGQLEQENNLVRLGLTLIDPKKMKEIGFAEIESRDDSLATMEDEAVTRLSRLMNLSSSETRALNSSRPVSQAAYEDYLLGIGYYQRHDKPGNIDLAIAALQNAIKQDPKFALAYARLAQVYTMKYRLTSDPQLLAQATAYGKRAAELDNQEPSTYVALGQIHEMTGNHDLAVEEFRRAITLDPRNAEAIAGLATSFQNGGHYAEAEAAYQKAIALRPDDWKGYNDLGIFYWSTGRPRDAIVQFNRALELTPDNAWPYTNLAMAYMDLDDPKMLDAAESALKKSIAIDPTYGAYANLGYLYAQEHRFPESVAASLAALKLNDRYYAAWDNLTAAYEWLHEDEKANEARAKTIAILEKAVQTNPQYAEGQATLAALYAKNGLKDQALDKIHISLALSPDNSYVLSLVADAYELLGDRRTAIRYLEDALARGLSRGQLTEDPEIQGVISDKSFRPPAK